MRSKTVHRLEVLSLATAGLCWLGASGASAQVYSPGGFTDTFDTPSSVSIGVANFNPPPVTARYDYGTGATTHVVSYSSTVDDTGNGGGSVKFTQFMDYPALGSGSVAYTMDLFPSPGAQVSDISFNLMVDPSSVPDKYGGYGYFQVFTRDSGYNDNPVPDIILNGTDLGANGYELGNPNYSGGVGDAGTWESLNIPFSGAGAQVRAITLQDFSDGGRDMDGDVIYYIDNLSITYVPEPASLGLLSLSIPALLARRRKAH
jgi:hypothetical protein